MLRYEKELMKQRYEEEESKEFEGRVVKRTKYYVLFYRPVSWYILFIWFFSLQ